MNLKTVLLLSIVFGILSCSEPPNEVELLHDHWEFRQFNMGEWKPATVPGTVQTDLLKQHDIPNPFKGNNEDSIQWISEVGWEYKTRFRVSEATLKKTKHYLTFHGLDTYAGVVLNDTVILHTANAFRNWEVDVSDLLQAENKLQILFFPVDIVEEEEAEKLPYTLPESPRVFSRKPQFQYGWDWGPTIKTMGIWRDVALISYDAVRIKDVYLETSNLNDSLAKITAKLALSTPEYDQVDVEIVNNTTGEKFDERIEIYGQDSTYDFPFNIKEPRLWWTHNLGEPFLYDITIRIKKGASVLEERSMKLGLRTIELITEKDSFGESFYFNLNGKPVYMKGANYIPQNIFLPSVTSEERRELLDDVVDANMNMLRVWGGGVYEDDEFYDLCDEKGILIWQDFMFACAMYPGDDAFLENVKREAVDNIKRLRNHASIGLWCGNNENSEGWARWGWADDKSVLEREQIWSDYHAVFNDILPKAVDSLHSGISYWESSPKYGRGDKRYQFEGDAHDWWVWHDGYPFEHFEEEVPRFMSEFGFQSFPSYEAIQYFTEKDTIDINHPSFANHQKHARGFQLIRDYMKRDFPVPENDEDYVYVSQLLQAHGITKGIMAHRRAKPYNMGTLYWQLNDCWPVVSWSSIDGMGNWKALHYKAKKAFENTVISTTADDRGIQVHLVNDTFEDIKDTLEISIVDFDGTVRTKLSVDTGIKSNSSDMVYAMHDMKSAKFDAKSSYLKFKFNTAEHLHYFEKPKDLNLIDIEPTVTIKPIAQGFDIEISTTTLLKDIFLYTATPGKFGDNYFDLEAGQTANIIFETDETSSPEIFIKTLNQIVDAREN